MRLISCRLRPTDATKPIRPPTHSPPEALPVVVGISLHPKQPQALCHPLWGPTAGRHPPPPSLLTWRGGEDSPEPVKSSRRTRKRKRDGGYVPTRTTYQPDVDKGPDTLGGVESAQKEVPHPKYSVQRCPHLAHRLTSLRQVLASSRGPLRHTLPSSF